MKIRAALCLLALLHSGCSQAPPTVEAPSGAAPFADYPDFEILRVLPHPPDSFTQGFVFVGDRLMESTGLRGQSRLRELDPETGAVLRERSLDSALFGEGLAFLEEQLFQLTWTAGQAFIVDPDTLEVQHTLTYEGEGWGLTDWRGRLLMTDGSADLAIRDPETFERLDTRTIQKNGTPVPRLNELETVEGWVLANIWQENRVVIFDPETGQVAAEADLSPLWHHLPSGARVDVLNGLAWRGSTRTLYATGKLWPVMFELRLKGFPPPR